MTRTSNPSPSQEQLAPPISIDANFRALFRSKVLSGSSIIWVYLNGDEGRCERSIEQLAKGLERVSPRPVYQTWDCVSGASWHCDQRTNATEKEPDPFRALAELIQQQHNAVTIFRDLHKYIAQDAQIGIRRRLIEIAKNNLLTINNLVKPIVILADTPTPHPDVKDYCDVIDFKLPTYVEMRTDVVDYTEMSAMRSLENEGRDPSTARISDDTKDRLTMALLGLTSEESTRVLCTAFSLTRAYEQPCFDVIAKEKANVLRKV